MADGVQVTIVAFILAWLLGAALLLAILGVLVQASGIAPTKPPDGWDACPPWDGYGTWEE